jgi:hypothetical protein
MKRVQGIYVKSQAGSSSASITRPDNTTAYAAGDVFGTDPATNIEFTNILQEAGQHFYIASVKLVYNVNAVPANMSTFTLHLFNAAPTAIADNAAWALLSADSSKYLGSIEITLPTDEGEVLVTFEDSINKKRKLASESTTIYGQLVTDGNFTPTSEAVVTITLETVGA